MKVINLDITPEMIEDTRLQFPKLASRILPIFTINQILIKEFGVDEARSFISSSFISIEIEGVIPIAQLLVILGSVITHEGNEFKIDHISDGDQNIYFYFKNTKED